MQKNLDEGYIYEPEGRERYIRIQLASTWPCRYRTHSVSTDGNSVSLINI